MNGADESKPSTAILKIWQTSDPQTKGVVLFPFVFTRLSDRIQAYYADSVA